jgi:hypothetical protein
MSDALNCMEGGILRGVGLQKIGAWVRCNDLTGRSISLVTMLSEYPLAFLLLSSGIGNYMGCG